LNKKVSYSKLINNGFTVTWKRLTLSTYEGCTVGVLQGDKIYMYLLLTV